jgi:hypothetical protein
MMLSVYYKMRNKENATILRDGCAIISFNKTFMNVLQ